MITRGIQIGDVKAKGDKGKFSGYAAVFSNVDGGFDVIEPGAFKEFATTKSGRIVVLHNHRTAEYIGQAEYYQDKKGLGVDGELVLGDPLAERVYTHMKAGTIDAMSIGYDVLPGGADFTEGGIRRLTALKLWEVSILPFGMNELARVEDVKTASNIKTIREFEDFLREREFTVAEARAVAEGGWPALQSLREKGAKPGAFSAQIEALISGRLFKSP